MKDKTSIFKHSGAGTGFYGGVGGDGGYHDGIKRGGSSHLRRVPGGYGQYPVHQYICSSGHRRRRGVFPVPGTEASGQGLSVRGPAVNHNRDTLLGHHGGVHRVPQRIPVITLQGCGRGCDEECQDLSGNISRILSVPICL